VTDSARSSPRVAIAWAVGAVLLVAWIGWAIYVTTENGGAAGLGVLISWPVAIAAIALVAAPFVGVYLLVQRIREPALAGTAGLADRADDSERSEAGKSSDDADDEDVSDDDALDAGDEADQADGDDDEEDDGDEPDEDDEPARA
jgi:hypothetical protein